MFVSCELACDLKVNFQNNNSNGGFNFESIIVHCNRKAFMFFCNSETFFFLLIHTFYYNHMISISRTQVLCTLNRINFVTGLIDGDIQMIFNVKQLQAVLLRYDHLRLFLTTNRIPVELRVPNLVFLILSVYMCLTLYFMLAQYGICIKCRIINRITTNKGMEKIISPNTCSKTQNKETQK